MSAITSRAMRVTSTLACAIEWTARKTRPVEIAHSAETSAPGSWTRNASTIASAIWSQILSGCPRVTDSDERIVRLAMSISLRGFGLPHSLQHLARGQGRDGTGADEREIGDAE